MVNLVIRAMSRLGEMQWNPTFDWAVLGYADAAPNLRFLGDYALSSDKLIPLLNQVNLLFHGGVPDHHVAHALLKAATVTNRARFL